MSKPRVKIGFGSLIEHDLEDLALAVLGGLYKHPEIYPDPPFTEAALRAKLKAFTDAIGAQANGGPAATALKNAAADSLILMLRQLALYVQKTIDENVDFGLAELLLSGFEAVSTSHARAPLAMPSIVDILNDGEGILSIRVTPIRNAKVYELQVKAANDADFHSFGLFESTRGMKATGLTPGVVYTFRVRAVGGSTGQSGWSNPVSHRSL